MTLLDTPSSPPAASITLAPIVLFAPAYDEERTVANVIARAPTTVRGHPVQVLVIDDGSTDRTAACAHGAGAEVVSLGRNLGLGAAVRIGLATAAARDVAAVAFLDADEEYAPEELDRLVGPILDGDADYVVGSRFRGDIERMLPHRRLGNRTLTCALRRLAGVPITDGQSGYRAFSPEAAAAAEVIHDFNYAQVLTLDLLAKGFRYHEVPITYRFRTEGRSFVRLLPYLRRVVPAVWRELRAA
jgi:glycosyltransferase involved in cell wall biosynthesis